MSDQHLVLFWHCPMSDSNLQPCISSRIGHRSYSASILKGIQGFEGCSLYAYFDNFAIWKICQTPMSILIYPYEYANVFMNILIIYQ